MLQSLDYVAKLTIPYIFILVQYNTGHNHMSRVYVCRMYVKACGIIKGHCEFSYRG